MPKLLGVTPGQRFGRLLTVKFCGGSKHPVWRCVCDCGKTTSASATQLSRASKRSCGCLRRELTSTRSTKHALSRSKVYNTWIRIKARCFNKKCVDFPNYGGRGITMCREWEESFERFLADVGFPPSKHHSIDRIDNNGNYEPGNCRWAIQRVQVNNTRANRFVTYKGQHKTLADWARKLGLPYGGLQHRLNRDWPVDEAFERPFRGHGVAVSYRR